MAFSRTFYVFVLSLGYTDFVTVTAVGVTGGARAFGGQSSADEKIGIAGGNEDKKIMCVNSCFH